MKNTIIAILIFLSLLGFVTYANYSLNNFCNDIKDISDHVEILIENEEWEEAYLRSLDIIDEIEDKRTFASVYVNHNEVDVVLNEAIRLSVYIKARNPSESLVSTSVLYNLAENIIELNKTNIQNIF